MTRTAQETKKIEGHTITQTARCLAATRGTNRQQDDFINLKNEGGGETNTKADGKLISSYIQEILGRTNLLLYFDDTRGPHRKRPVHKFLYCFVCLCC
jgi:hypothetical protein